MFKAFQNTVSQVKEMTIWNTITSGRQHQLSLIFNNPFTKSSSWLWSSNTNTTLTCGHR